MSEEQLEKLSLLLEEASKLRQAHADVDSALRQTKELMENVQTLRVEQDRMYWLSLFAFFFLLLLMLRIVYMFARDVWGKKKK